MNKFINWKKVIFAIAIMLLYVPMVYLGVNTFFPDFDQDDCYGRVASPTCKFDAEGCAETLEKNRIEQNECYKEYRSNKNAYEGNKYIVIMIITLITSFVMLANLDKSIIYGLFFGVIITAFTGTIRYIDSKSIIGFALMVTLFITIIVFIQKRKQ